MTATIAEDLAAPWGGALLQFIADPLINAAPEALPVLPIVGSTAKALTFPALRGRLGRALCDGSPEAIRSLQKLTQHPNTRLALFPAQQALALMAFATAWSLASAIGKLIRQADVRRARDSLGDEAFSFAVNRAQMMPPINAALATAIGLNDPSLEMDRIAELRPGAALFGLALGPLPKAAMQRLSLRQPVSTWSVVCTHAREDESGSAAVIAIRRILRDRGMPCSTWLN